MRKILTQKFFERPAEVVAQDLLLKYLVRRINRKEIALRIVEVEAYHGTEDLASHASKGRTERTEPMFGEAGRLYIYLIYGMYFMLNVVTDKKDFPSAVLIRGVEGISGPGKLTRELEIDKKWNGKRAEKSESLWFEDRGEKPLSRNVLKKPRVGVEYAGEVWSQKLYRYVYLPEL